MRVKSELGREDVKLYVIMFIVHGLFLVTEISPSLKDTIIVHAWIISIVDAINTAIYFLSERCAFKNVSNHKNHISQNNHCSKIVISTNDRSL